MCYHRFVFHTYARLCICIDFTENFDLAPYMGLFWKMELFYLKMCPLQKPLKTVICMAVEIFAVYKFHFGQKPPKIPILTEM